MKSLPNLCVFYVRVLNMYICAWVDVNTVKNHYLATDFNQMPCTRITGSIIKSQTHVFVHMNRMYNSTQVHGWTRWMCVRSCVIYQLLRLHECVRWGSSLNKTWDYNSLISASGILFKQGGVCLLWKLKLYLVFEWTMKENNLFSFYVFSIKAKFTYYNITH